MTVTLKKCPLSNPLVDLATPGLLCNSDYMLTTESLRGWFSGRLPEAWFAAPPEVVLDREEITVVGRLPEPAMAEGVSDGERAGVIAGHLQRFREETRD